MTVDPRRRRAPIRGISAVLPAYNQAANLTPVVEAVLDALIDVVPAYEVIIVDDGSTDATRRIANELASLHPEVRVLHRARSRGVGAAWREGLAAATKQYTLWLDPDRRYAPEDLARLVTWDDQYDLVTGFRAKRLDSMASRTVGVVFHLIVRFGFGLRFRDVNCGFKLARTSLAKSLPLTCSGSALHTELLARAVQAGALTREVGVRSFPQQRTDAPGRRFWLALRALRELAALHRALAAERRQATSKEKTRPAADETTKASPTATVPGEGLVPSPQAPAGSKVASSAGVKPTVAAPRLAETFIPAEAPRGVPEPAQSAAATDSPVSGSEGVESPDGTDSAVSGPEGVETPGAAGSASKAPAPAEG